MASWFGSISFVLFSALFGCIFGFGIAATRQGIKDRKREKLEKQQQYALKEENNPKSKNNK